MKSKKDNDLNLSPQAKIENLGTFDLRIIDTLRRNEGIPTTYDRIASQMVLGVEKYRNVSSKLGRLKKKGIVDVGPERLITIMGRTANGYILRPPYTTIKNTSQESLFELDDYQKTIREAVESLILGIGKKGQDPLEVALSAIDIMLGMRMPADLTFDITEEMVTTPAPYQKSSETSKAAAEATKYFRGRARRRVYNGLMQCYRAKGRGVTREEIRAATGVIPQTLLPRIKEMCQDGYILVVGQVKNPTTGHMQEILTPTNQVALVSGTPSSYYTDRLKIVEHIQTILTTPVIAAKYLAEPGKLFDVLDNMIKEFIAKYAKPIHEVELTGDDDFVDDQET